MLMQWRYDTTIEKADPYHKYHLRYKGLSAVVVWVVTLRTFIVGPNDQEIPPGAIFEK
jgi:hypothetical protein